jgi:hypothetical protein
MNRNSLLLIGVAAVLGLIALLSAASWQESVAPRTQNAPASPAPTTAPADMPKDQ